MRRCFRSLPFWVLLGGVAARPLAGSAALLPLDPASFADPNSLLNPSIVSDLVKSVGTATDHRAYESATPYGMQGADIGVEFSMVKLPDAFNTALAAAGGGSAAGLPFVPLPRVNIHKGFSEAFDLGFSGIWFQGIRLYGYEAKFNLARPEEGPTWAFRLSYTRANFKVENGAVLQLVTDTFTPVVMISRKLDFADPYLGVGAQLAFGSLSLTLPAVDPAVTLSASGRGVGAIAFTGVTLKLPQLGFKLSVEGAYSSAGASALGGKFGLSF